VGADRGDPVAGGRGWLAVGLAEVIPPTWRDIVSVMVLLYLAVLAIVAALGLLAVPR
jgi:hypothetical protein